MQVYQQIPFDHVHIRGGYWGRMQETISHTTAMAVYEQFCRSGRFEALKCRPLQPGEQAPHIFWDSDVYKWIEGVAYITRLHHDAELERLADEAIEDIAVSCAPDGYFNSHFLVTEQSERFCQRDSHELYCAGHMFEAAVAYAAATGKTKLLDIATRYADLIYRIFIEEKSAKFETCGHPEVELALAALYEYTGEKRYYDLGLAFLNARGNNEKDKAFLKDEGLTKPRISQSHLPARKQHTAEGHAVRAGYFYCAMADYARLSGDDALLAACRDLFDDIVNRKAYLTGGVGSTYIGEAFTVPYDLDPKGAYAETCASISMAMFAARMLEIEPNARYADLIEQEFYNGISSGMSLEGDAFFYENPLELDPVYDKAAPDIDRVGHRAITERVKLFYCSCCPPNLVRFFPSAGKLLFSQQGDTLYVNQFAGCSADTPQGTVTMETAYPADGVIRLTVPAGYHTVAVRIPGWCRHFTAEEKCRVEKGYAYFANTGKTLTLRLEIKPVWYEANARVHACGGRLAAMRGPIVYCAESVDNGPDLSAIRVLPEQPFALSENAAYPIPDLTVAAERQASCGGLYAPYERHRQAAILRLIPFFAHANRGSTEMRVWLSY